MSQTKTSIRRQQQHKIVTVKGHTKKDGTKVRAHKRSTPLH